MTLREEPRRGAEEAPMIGDDAPELRGAAGVVERELVEGALAVLHERRVEVDDVTVEDDLDGFAGAVPQAARIPALK